MEKSKQVERIATKIQETFQMWETIGGTLKTKQEWGKGYHLKDEPTMTISTQQTPRAFLTNLDNASREFTVRQEDEPYPTLTASAMRRDVSTPKAYITAGGDAWSPVLDDTAPLFTLSSSKAEHATRAFIMPNANTTSAVKRFADEPSNVVGNTQRVGNIPRVYLVNESSTMETADAAQPANAQVSSAHNVNQKAYLQYGRVVKMTPRALARFQSTPNCYRFPRRARERKLTFQEKNWIASIDGKLTIAQQEYLHEYLVGNDALICKIEGNKVPPLLMQCVIGANL